MTWACIEEGGEGAVLHFGGIDAGRVQPCVAKADEFAGGIGDRLNTRIVGF